MKFCIYSVIKPFNPKTIGLALFIYTNIFLKYAPGFSGFSLTVNDAFCPGKSGCLSHSTIVHPHVVFIFFIIKGYLCSLLYSK